MYSSGYCLLHGEGAGRDAAAGVRWLRRAAAQGEANACHELALHHLRGDGGAAGKRAALRWLRVAARLGHVAAGEQLAAMEGGVDDG